LVLQTAIGSAGTTDTPSVQAALDATDIVTFFGRIKFSLSQANHGLQIGHEMVYIQWQEGLDGVLTKRIIWPVELATSPLLYPIH
jgi:branched-chain amino acid transport system substrate-binding protein